MKIEFNKKDIETIQRIARKEIRHLYFEIGEIFQKQVDKEDIVGVNHPAELGEI